MNISRIAKFVLAGAGVVTVGLFAVVVDVGISAGRIHSGVSINELDVGGLTEIEAVELLTERAEVLGREPVCFVAEFINPCFLPSDVGWRPRVVDAAHDAMRVGRDAAPFGALYDRLRSWFGGVRVPWTGSPRAGKVTMLIADWEKEAAGLGMTIDAAKLRYRLKRAIVTWPRRTFNLPVSDI